MTAEIDRGIAPLKHITLTRRRKMARKLSDTLVTMFQNMFDSRSAQEKYLSQSTDICDLENRMKKLHTTHGRFGI